MVDLLRIENPLGKTDVINIQICQSKLESDYYLSKYSVTQLGSQTYIAIFLPNSIPA